MDPEARLLRYFLAVAEELNFTRAARKLHIAQPALSAQIHQLETQLGVRLLERTTRAVALTDAGRALQDRGPAALAALEQAWDAARRAGRGRSGRLRLAYGASTGYDTTPRLVQALQQHYPDIEISTEVLPTPEIVRAVLDGRADAGLAREPPVAEGLRLRPVRHDRQGVLVRTGHPLAARAEVELAAVAEYPILLHPRAANPGHYDLVIDQFRRAGLKPRLAEPAVAFDPGRQAILAGRAIGLVGAASATDLPDELRWVPLAEPAARVTIALVLREGTLPPAVTRFERVAVATATAAGWLDDPGATTVFPADP